MAKRYDVKRINYDFLTKQMYKVDVKNVKSCPRSPRRIYCDHSFKNQLWNYPSRSIKKMIIFLKKKNKNVLKRKYKT